MNCLCVCLWLCLCLCVCLHHAMLTQSVGLLCLLLVWNYSKGRLEFLSCNNPSSFHQMSLQPHPPTPCPAREYYNRSALSRNTNLKWKLASSLIFSRTHIIATTTHTASSVCWMKHRGQAQTRYLSFFLLNVLLGSIFLHMKARKLWQNEFRDKTVWITDLATKGINFAYMATFSTSHTCHVRRISDFSISVMWRHLKFLHMWKKFSISPQFIIHGKLKFLHMTIFLH